MNEVLGFYILTYFKVLHYEMVLEHRWHHQPVDKTLCYFGNLSPIQPRPIIKTVFHTKVLCHAAIVLKPKLLEANFINYYFHH